MKPKAVTPTPLTPAQRSALDKIARAFDRSPWAVADLAREWRAKKVPDYCQRIGGHRDIRRSVRTIRHYAHVADVVDDLITRAREKGLTFDRRALTFYGWSAIVAYAPSLSFDRLIDAIDITSASEATVEEIESFMRLRFGSPQDETPRFTEWQRAATHLSGDLDRMPADLRTRAREAIKTLAEIAEAWRSRLVADAIETAGGSR